MLKSLGCLRKRSGSSSVTQTSRPWEGVACTPLAVGASNTKPAKSSKDFRQNFFSAFWDYCGGDTVVLYVS